MSKIELNLTEDNEIGFKLKIEGSDKEIAGTKPKIRFLVTEEETGKGWVFSTDKTEDGVSVVIPCMKGIISEDKKYQGKLEVILGGRYFTPTETEIEFIEPLKVEAAVSTTATKKSSTNILEESSETPKEEFNIESEIDSVIVKEEKRQTFSNSKLVVENEKFKPKNYSELSDIDKNKVNLLFLNKCDQYGIESKEVSKLMKEGTSFTKKRLKALLAQATKEYIEKL